ncbi:MAG: M20/M25/M40 family metallo-hydrolase [bacterium]
MINKKRLINTFKALVKIDSLSLKEAKVVAYLEKELKKLGLKPYQVGKPAEGEVGNLIVDLPGKGKRIILNAHVDTVAPGKKIKPVQKGNHIYSEGHTVLGADDKTGVAVILEVLRTIKEQKLAHPPIRVIFTVAEEIGLVGARCLPRRVFSGDFCITLDHGKPHEIIYKAPAQQNITAKIYGKSAHAGIHPEQGINAIKVASIAIAKMRFGRIDNETTSNIGVIKGGKATNVVPDKVEIKGEARSHNPAKLKKQIDHMKKILKKTCLRFGARLKVTVEKVYNSFEIKKSSQVMKAALAAVEKAGLKPVLQQTGGGSDANIFNEAGVPTVIFGSGMHQVHTTKEFANVNELATGAEVVLNMVLLVVLKGIK